MYCIHMYCIHMYCIHMYCIVYTYVLYTYVLYTYVLYTYVIHPTLLHRLALQKCGGAEIIYFGAEIIYFQSQNYLFSEPQLFIYHTNRGRNQLLFKFSKRTAENNYYKDNLGSSSRSQNNFGSTGSSSATLLFTLTDSFDADPEVKYDSLHKQNG